jgi:hypothetical protein
VSSCFLNLFCLCYEYHPRATVTVSSIFLDHHGNATFRPLDGYGIHMLRILTGFLYSHWLEGVSSDFCHIPKDAQSRQSLYMDDLGRTHSQPRNGYSFLSVYSRHSPWKVSPATLVYTNNLNPANQAIIALVYSLFLV